jgi:hypothetical protein
VRFPLKNTLQLATMIALSQVFLAAQTANVKTVSIQTPEPEAIGVFYYLDSSTQTLKRLPKEDFKRHTGGFGSITQSIHVSGNASSLSVGHADQTVLVFKVFKDEEAAKAKLFQFSVKGSEREYDLGKWKRRDFTPNEGVTINVAKFGESSYKLTPETPLSPGEYAVTLGPSVFTFSVQ